MEGVVTGANPHDLDASCSHLSNRVQAELTPDLPAAM
jgi:hypothetical protein